MEITIQGKELTLEARIIGALAARIERGTIQSRTVTLDELAAVKGVILDREGGLIVPRVQLHKPEPMRFKIGGGDTFLNASELLVDSERYDIVMTDRDSGCVWGIPAAL